MRHIKKKQTAHPGTDGSLFSMQGENRPEADDGQSMTSGTICAALKALAVPSLMNGHEVWNRYQIEPYAMQLTAN